MASEVQIERCILRAQTFDGYRNILESSGHTDGDSSLLHLIMQHYGGVRLGQTIPASGDCLADLTVVDLIPATAGTLCDATTIVVLPPVTSTRDSTDDNSACNAGEVVSPIPSDNISCYGVCVCVVLLDFSLTGTTAVASREFLLRTLLPTGAVVCVGDEEYTTAFIISEEEEKVTGQKVPVVQNDKDDDYGSFPIIRTSPDVFRNIRASIALDTLPSVSLEKVRFADRCLHVPLSAFCGVQDATGQLIRISTTDDSAEFWLKSVVLVPAWPEFILKASLGEDYERVVKLALHACKEDLHGRFLADGDVIVLRVTPRLFAEKQLSCMDATEAVLAHVAHLVQSNALPRQLTKEMVYDNVLAIPLRVLEVVGPTCRPYGKLNLSGGTTELLLTLRGSMPSADATPLFPPLSPMLHPFYMSLSFTESIRKALRNRRCYHVHLAARGHVFVVHATKDNFPYECIATVLAENGVEGLVVDLDSWSDEKLKDFVVKYMQHPSGVSLVIRNAQQLSDRPHILYLFDMDESGTNVGDSDGVVFLVCECVESPSPVVAACACNVEGVLRGTNPLDPDRQRIIASIFDAAERFLGLCRSMLLSVELLVSWTVGLSVADVVAYAQECVLTCIAMQLPDGVRPVLSESLCKAVLERFQKTHGHNLVSTKLQPVRWSDVGGLEEAKRELRETIQIPLLHPELFCSGLKRRAGILLYGPPGCGKTLLAKAVATEMNMNFMAVKGPELINQYVGESEKNIRLLFQRARDNSPCIIFFDELDALVPARGAKGDAGGAMDRVVAQLLVEVDGVGHTRSDGTAPAHVFIIGATNRPDLLDPSLLRPGRFDRLCYLGVPSTREEQLVAVRALTRKFDLSDDVDLEALLEPMSLEYTGADLFALCSDAMMFAVEALLESATGTDDYDVAAGAQTMEDQHGRNRETPPLVVRMRDFVRARNQLKPSVTAEDLLRYEALRTKFTSL